MIKVSIIVPIYNSEKYLDECLNSLINQTLKEIEIICVNDGSKDNSLKIIQKYAQKDSRIKIIDQNNLGVAQARNVGIKMATGEYLGFVDADDFVDYNYYEELYDSASKNNCDIAVAGFKRKRIYRESIRKNYKKSEIVTNINDKVIIDNIPDHNYIWNKIYRRKSFLQIGIFFPQGRYFEDFATTIKILYHLDKMITVPNIYYHYRKSSNSIITTNSPKHNADYIWARTEFYNFVKEKNIQIKQCHTILKRCYLKIFSFTFLKIYYYENIIKYKLFGFIPILTKEEA